MKNNTSHTDYVRYEHLNHTEEAESLVLVSTEYFTSQIKSSLHWLPLDRVLMAFFEKIILPIRYQHYVFMQTNYTTLFKRIII